MSDKITTNGTNKKEYYQDELINVASNRSYGENCILSKNCNGKKYVIAFNGEIYNKDKIKEIIISNGIHLEGCTDSEIVLSSYILWKEECLNRLKGAFSFIIWCKDNNKLFLARDQLGIKPLFYTCIGKNLIFSTEIKCLFEYTDINAIIDKDGISQLFGLGPARIEGKCVFKDIFEVEPANYIEFNNFFLKKTKYWKLKSMKHEDDEDTTIMKVRKLLNNSIISQIKTGDKIGSMLSGGLDSSIIASVICDEYKKEGKKLKTFSVDYIDNDKNFKANDFQPDSDNKYIEIMKEKYDFEHKYIKLDSKELIDSLYSAMKARDLPGMADVDSSLLEFLKAMKEDVDIVLSGEFADETFGGYPWFYREECLNSDTFPWSISLDTRQRILNKKYSDINLKEYTDNIYNEFVKKTPIRDEEGEMDKKIKKLMYLNIHWFGATLVDRTDRMSVESSLIVRVPFMDYELLQYIWNIPWKMKTLLNREKGLLRVAYKDTLPEEVCFRKKSPYPKTYNPEYTNNVKEKLLEILNDDTQPILQLIDKEEVLNIINNLDEIFTRPWFGQLMTGTQFMAYLIQINMWLIEYNIEIVD